MVMQYANSRLLLKIKKNNRLIIGSAILLVFFIIVFVLPIFYLVDAFSIDFPHKMQPPFQAGLSRYPLGTDSLGRDMLSRLIYGSRISLLIGIVTTLTTVIIGAVIGMIAGYLGGAVENILMRITDTIMCYPFTIIAIVAAALLEPGIYTIIIIFSAFGWTNYARTIRGVVLGIKEREYVEASQALGANSLWIIIKHIFPNILATLIVVATLQIRIMILAEATLSFLGVGIQPPTPSLGVIINQGREYLTNAWWIAVMPGIALVFVVLGFNLLGDGLNDRINPMEM